MKTVCVVLLIAVALGHGLQVAEKVEKNGRRDLLVITGPAILAACISGAVGGIIGAVATTSIDACGGRRDKTIVVVRDETSGKFVQRNSRRLLMGGKDPNVPVVETNKNGVSFGGTEVCPPDHMVAALYRDEGGVVTIPEQYFNQKKFYAMDQTERVTYRALTPLQQFQRLGKRVIKEVVQPQLQQEAEKRKKFQPVIQELKSKQGEPGMAQVRSSAGTYMPYIPYATFGVAFLLMVYGCMRSTDDRQKHIYKELLEEPL